MTRPCPRCDGGGLIAVDRRLVDERTPSGGRWTVDVYRCSCPAGERMSAKFLPEPIPPKEDRR